MSIETESNEYSEVLPSTFDEDLAYIKNVEREFADRVDDVLEMLDLSHLRVKDKILVELN